MENFPLIIVACVAATISSRLAGLVLSKKDISPKFERWLQHIPIAVLVALIVPDFFEKAPALTLNTPYVLAGTLSLIVGLASKNMVFATTAGVLTITLLRLI